MKLLTFFRKESVRAFVRNTVSVGKRVLTVCGFTLLFVSLGAISYGMVADYKNFKKTFDKRSLISSSVGDMLEEDWDYVITGRIESPEAEEHLTRFIEEYPDDSMLVIFSRQPLTRE